MNPSATASRDLLRAIARRAMLERGLLPDFSPAVLAETAAITTATTSAGGTIRDFRSLLWASIDNDDSRDLDQLSVAQPLAAIDGHAQTNTTSVYTPGGIFPMLPEKLSTDLTSLAAERERLAIVIAMTVAADGSVGESEVYRAAVVNRAKLAYDSVAAWLDGREAAPPAVATVPGMDAQLRVQDRIAQALKTRRHTQGALSLEVVEGRAVFDGDALTDLRPDERNRAKDLIEDFMIAANGVTAAYLERRGFPSLRRVLRSPDRWERIVALAAATGDRLPPPRAASRGRSGALSRPVARGREAPRQGRVRSATAG